MKIKLDYNNDEVVISSKNQVGAVIKITGSLRQIQTVLEEVLNRLDGSRLSSATPYFDIALISENEDNRKTIGEW